MGAPLRSQAAAPALSAGGRGAAATVRHRKVHNIGRVDKQLLRVAQHQEGSLAPASKPGHMLGQGETTGHMRVLVAAKTRATCHCCRLAQDRQRASSLPCSVHVAVLLVRVGGSWKGLNNANRGCSAPGWSPTC